MAIMEHTPLAQGPDNRGGAKGQHRAQGKHPRPHDVTQEQARDTTAGGDKDNLVHCRMGHGGQHPGGPYLAGYYLRGQLQPGGHTTTRNWHTGWDDQLHPKIKDMMHNYLVCINGCVHLAEILDTAGKRQNDLPTLPKYIHPSGRPFLCWSSILGKCTFRDCRYRKEEGHPLPADITDEFANQCIDAINKGIIAISRHQGGSPNKKLKGNDGNP
jgi:hypothetical protein